MKTWEEIRDEVAGMLADGVPLEDITGKLEKLKNEYQKSLTNEEYIRQCSTEELAIFLCNELQDDEVGRTLANRFERELYSEYPIRPMNAYHEVMRWLKEKHNE